MQKKTSIALLAALGLSAPLSVFAAPSVAGTWKSIDDETNKPKSHIEITIEDGKASGRIVKLLNPSKPNPKCTECEGAKKGKPIEGLEIMWGLEKKADADRPTWEGGKILDPENGKTYDCEIWLESDDELIVRGSWLMFGREQTWHRLDESASKK